MALADLTAVQEAVLRLVEAAIATRHEDTVSVDELLDVAERALADTDGRARGRRATRCALPRGDELAAVLTQLVALETLRATPDGVALPPPQLRR
jgi:hypothetical protein